MARVKGGVSFKEAPVVLGGTGGTRPQLVEESMSLAFPGVQAAVAAPPLPTPVTRTQVRATAGGTIRPINQNIEVRERIQLPNPPFLGPIRGGY